MPQYNVTEDKITYVSVDHGYIMEIFAMVIDMHIKPCRIEIEIHHKEFVIFINNGHRRHIIYFTWFYKVRILFVALSFTNCRTFHKR